MNPCNSKQYFVASALLAMSVVLSACGGGEGGSSPANTTAPPETSEVSKPSSMPDILERPVWIEGYAVKGAINNGLVRVWRLETSGSQYSWTPLDTNARTQSDGSFKFSVPGEYSNDLLKVVLRADSQTMMRCDVLPKCVDPLGGNVEFGDWFSPGPDLRLVTLAKSSVNSPAISLTPLGTLVANHQLHSGDLEFQRGYADQGIEAQFGLGSGTLQMKPLDLSALENGYASIPELKAAFVNAAFMALVDGQRWKTLSEVIDAAENSMSGAGQLPVEAGNQFSMSLELIALSALMQAQYFYERSSRELGSSRSEIKGTIESLTGTLFSTGYESFPSDALDSTEAHTETGPQPDPAPDPDKLGTTEEDESSDGGQVKGSISGSEIDSGSTSGSNAASSEDLEETSAAGSVQGRNDGLELEAGNNLDGNVVGDPEEDSSDEADSQEAPDEGSGARVEESSEADLNSATLSWQPPLTREDGSALAMGELDGYVLRYGTEKDIESMSNELVVEDGQSMELKITGLDRGTWYFAMRSVDVDGLKSQWSSVVSKTIN
ncbi:hypothetical protein [Marinobacter sp. NFXS9]|uniref:fibronectin type III domain-containing protein n=1 Tax=Marinobacter sp. NFXS9 TaxID=2818433 RepID=UPI0032DF3B5E